MILKRKAGRIWALTALVCALALLLSLCGCSSGESSFSLWEYFSGIDEPEYEEIRISLPVHAGYSAAQSADSYSALTSDAQRQAYLSIEKSLSLISPEESEDGRWEMAVAKIPSLSSGEIFMVKEAVLADHPEVFWISGDYTLGRTLADGMYLRLYSDYSPELIISMTKALEKAISALLKEIPSNLGEYERELIIHDCILESCRYDSASVETAKSYTGPASSYGALVNKSALCSGYAKAVKLLLNRVGISCRTVKGIAGGVGHMWDLVRIDGKWYHLDPTWNDAHFSTDTISYDYFNLSDSMIEVDHTVSPGYYSLSGGISDGSEGNSLNFYNFDLPSCSSLDANYYTKNAVLIDDLGQKGAAQLRKLLLERVEGGKAELVISFPEYMEPDIISAWLMTSLKEEAQSINELDAGRLISAYTFNDRSGDENTPWTHVYCITIIY